ncbi:hypothetical protein FA15DRAFT_691953 [Coprinopsis marcescibilis]|uniref:F-box domain-containing protein n=1 Tax=Coprinopsis marcescibilis TaxID=230819 RepID=A0A5C3L5J3_COPMA|nr:hypothetical protein FA15DRAFT_691953 [Coprinopsis marcescibilis]
MANRRPITRSVTRAAVARVQAPAPGVPAAVHRLPLELVSMVMIELDGDKNTIRASGFVGRVWNQSSRDILFRRVELGPTTIKCKRLTALLKKNPGLSTSIRTLEVYDSAVGHNTMLGASSPLPALLELLKDLVDVYISPYTASIKWDRVSLGLRQALLKTFALPTTCSVTFGDGVNLLAEFILGDMADHPKRLTLENVSIHPIGRLRAKRVHKLKGPVLESLEIKHKTPFVGLVHLTSFWEKKCDTDRPFTRNLRLSLQEDEKNFLVNWEKIPEQFFNHIHRYDWVFSMYDLPPNVSAFKNLRIFHVTLNYWTGWSPEGHYRNRADEFSDPLKILAEDLRRASLNDLREFHLELGISMDNHVEVLGTVVSAHDWIGLDKAIGKATSTTLQEVCIYLSDDFNNQPGRPPVQVLEAISALKKKMPLAMNSGKLQVHINKMEDIVRVI